MNRGASGFIGGVVGGLLEFLIEEGSFWAGWSQFSRVTAWRRVFSEYLNLGNLFAGPTRGFAALLVHVVITGILGYIFGRIVRGNFLALGITAGGVAWVIMGLLRQAMDIYPAVWNLGLGTTLATLASHLVLGATIGYATAALSQRAVRS